MQQRYEGLQARRMTGPDARHRALPQQIRPDLWPAVSRKDSPLLAHPVVGVERSARVLKLQRYSSRPDGTRQKRVLPAPPARGISSSACAELFAAYGYEKCACRCSSQPSCFNAR